jgi:hypothetical protein
MQAVTTIDLDIAKSVFQLHGIDVEGEVVIRRQLKRRYVLAFFQKLPSCLVGISLPGIRPSRWTRSLWPRSAPNSPAMTQRFAVASEPVLPVPRGYETREAILET